MKKDKCKKLKRWIMYEYNPKEDKKNDDKKVK